MDEGPLGDALKDYAVWGAIAFDHYALEHWNFDAPHEEDGAQWRALVGQYLDSPLEDRQLYKDKATAVQKDGLNNTTASLLTASNIDRVLKPFQSIRERNVSQINNPGEQVWIVACYEESLHEKYCKLESQSEVGGVGVAVEMVLSDANIYNINGNIESLRARITERLPGLFDHGNAISTKAPRRRVRATAIKDVPELSDYNETFVYVADKECVLGGFVKIFWFDCRGQLLFVSRIDPEEVEGMTGMFADGYSMVEAVEEKCLSESKRTKSAKSLMKPTQKSTAKEDSEAEWETESEYGSN